MATYVFSDVHGHHRTLERLLDKVSPSEEDEIWILGDMVDRGPDPVSVMRVCRDLRGAHIIMGNHEAMMVDYERDPSNQLAEYSWVINGGMATREGLDALTREERIDFVDWVADLPLYAHIHVGERDYLLVHAGVRRAHFTSHSHWSDATMDRLLMYQEKEDLLWIRDDFWGQPTGLINEQGKGPIVIACHTPVPYVPDYTHDDDREPRNEDGQCQVMHLGACEATGQVADRWAIDCGAAGGAGWGGIAMIRLADGDEEYKEEYVYVEEGE